jgi:hypothetical protein
MAGGSSPASPRNLSMLSETTRVLIIEVLHGNTRAPGLRAFIKNAKTKAAKEIATHLRGYKTLAASYDRLPDGHPDVASVIDAMAMHEDWFEARLVRAA